ncbi:MAG: aldo/keto reductase [Anaeroplasmataceae bacterium]
MRYITLRNGVRMPILGFGTARMKGLECKEAVKKAILCGYELIDTADMYENEADIGNALLESNVKRENLFITSKLYSKTNTYLKATNQIHKLLSLLNTSYIDLVLIHEPFETDYEVYKALEEFYNKGIIKAIGVSNFNEEYLSSFIKKVNIIPMINQVECHPYFQELKLKEYLDSNNIIMESYSPFISGLVDIKEDKVLKEIAMNHNKTPYQIILNYLTNLNIICIPKTTSIIRMKENLDIFNFKLTEDEINKIKELDTNKSYYGWY